jgi:hypothetical protein
MRKLHSRLDAMEIAQRRETNVGNISEVESEYMEVKGYIEEEAAEERFFIVVAKMGAREKM